jgi:hypothetical protein
MRRNRRARRSKPFPSKWQFRPFHPLTRMRRGSLLKEWANGVPVQETISHQALLSTLWQLIGEYPNRDNSDPPGPWDPMIRRALQYSLWVLGPRLDPWRWQNAVGSKTYPLIPAEINPQPLPPRALLFATIARGATIFMYNGRFRCRVYAGSPKRCVESISLLRACSFSELRPKHAMVSSPKSSLRLERDCRK